MSKENRAPFAADGKDDPANWFLSLSKVMGRRVADVEVFVTKEFGDPTLALYRIVFDDGSTLHCEGEHDLPYLTNGYGDNGAAMPDLAPLREDD